MMSRSVRNPFTVERRRQILDECFIHMKTIEDLEMEFEEAEGGYAKTLDRQLEYAETRLDELIEEYREGVPWVDLSRCPFCGRVLKHSIDIFGIDGLWWDKESPVRPDEENLCSHYLALDGAMRIVAPVEQAPILVCPGPDVPYVVPRLLTRVDVRAVISAVKVGAHTGYPIFYFAHSPPPDLELVNTWGTNMYSWTTPDGDFAWDEHIEDVDDVDFDLGRWIASGRLMWIAPDDDSFTVRDSVAKCPYVKLDGSGQLICVRHGKVWHSPLPPAPPK